MDTTAHVRVAQLAAIWFFQKAEEIPLIYASVKFNELEMMKFTRQPVNHPRHNKVKDLPSLIWTQGAAPKILKMAAGVLL